MKTLFICTKKAIVQHVDEEYDEILYVADDIHTGNIDSYALLMKDAIHRLDAQDEKENGADKKIVVSVDASPAIHIIMSHLQPSMKEKENIIIELAQKK
jgi:hypothetical protein